MKHFVLWVLLVATLLFCALPHFHPDSWLGGYKVWVDLLLHSGYFLVLSFFIFTLVRTKQRYLLWLLLLGGILFEMVQAFIPGRTFSYMDMMSNTAGICTAALLYKRLVFK